MSRPIAPRPRRIDPLWVRVERNRLKLLLFIGLFLLGCVVAAEVMVFVPLMVLMGVQCRFAGFIASSADRMPQFAAYLALCAVTVGVIHVASSLGRPTRRMLPTVGARPLERGELLATKYALKDMAVAAGIAVAPELFVIDTYSVNAFVLGLGRRERPVVVVTTGLVRHLDVEEQRAVFANLVARLRSGDVAWATAVSALMSPIWLMRERQFQSGEGPMFVAGDPTGRATFMSLRASPDAGALAVWAFFTYTLSVAVTEIMAVGMRRTHLAASETADAEGMLLLKDPGAMLRALRTAIEADNRVRAALPLYAGLFYIWAGDGVVAEDDPEWRRLDRLREVVGIDGAMDAEAEAREATEAARVLADASPPAAPALDESRRRGA